MYPYGITYHGLKINRAFYFCIVNRSRGLYFVDGWIDGRKRREVRRMGKNRFRALKISENIDIHWRVEKSLSAERFVSSVTPYLLHQLK